MLINKRNVVVLLLAAGVFVLQNCSKKDSGTTTSPTSPITPTVTLDLPATPFNYANVTYPAHIAVALAANDNSPAGNPITDAGATLGRVLFYDKNLSKNNTISCASCHKQEIGFTDNAQFSTGFAGGLTTRTSMSLLNTRFYKSGKMFWDERASTLEAQVLQPIQNTVEMGMTLAELVPKLQALSYYPDLFSKAFGSTTIDTVKISRALAQFVRSIVTYQAKYDRVKQGLTTFTQDEADGEQIFLTATGPGGGPTCAGCHTPPAFITSSPAAPFQLPDPTDAGIQGQHRFKSGSLRNITTTTNLFHNGSIANVQAMLNGGVPAHGVAPQDRAKILAFLQSLTDVAVTTDVKFTTPFK